MVAIKSLDEALPIVEMKDRLSTLEKYGIYTSLTDIRDAPAGNFPYTLLTGGNKVDYTYTLGNYTGQVDNKRIIKLNSVPINQGALVRQELAGLSFQAKIANSSARDADDRLQDFAVSPEDFEAVGDGITDDSDALQKCFDAMAARKKFGMVRCSFNKIYYIANPDGLKIDVSYTSVDGMGSSFKFAGDGFTISGTEPIPFNQGNQAIRNLRVVGPGQFPSVAAGTVGAGTSVGMRYQGIDGTPSGPQHIKSYDIHVSLFDVGFLYGYNAILLDHFGCSANNCNIGIKSVGGAGDTNEGVKWIGGAIYNCGLAVQQSDIANNGSIALMGVHLDYCDKVILITTGAIVVGWGLWIEAHNWTSAPFEINGTNTQNALMDLNILKMVTGTTGPAATYSHVAKGQYNTTISLDFGFVGRIQPSSDAWYSGAGDFKVRTKSSPTFTQLPHVLREDQSLLIDGNYQLNFIADDTFISTIDSSTQTIADRFRSTYTADSATAIFLSPSTEYAVEGSNSLSVLKNSGAGSNAEIVIALVPAEADANYGIRFKMRKPGASVGGLYINFLWIGGDARDPLGRLPFKKVQPFESIRVDFDGNDSGWITFTNPNVPARKPSWARYLAIVADCKDWNAMGDRLYFARNNVDRTG